MIPRLEPLVLLLIGITVCLTITEGTPGADIVSRKEPINNLVEDATKLNLVKKEAISEAKKKEIKKKKRKIGIRKRSKKRGDQNGRKGSKKVFHKKGGNDRRAKDSDRKKKGGKNKVKNDKKKKKSYQKEEKSGKKKKRKNNKRMKKIKKKGPIKGQVRQSSGCGSVAAAADTISEGIYEFRKFFNHYKKINRTDGYLKTIERKAKPSKLTKYEEAAAYLKSVTKNGKECPADPHLDPNVTEIVANLTQCGNAETSNIVLQCNTNKIKGFLKNLIDQEFCAGEYAEYIPEFTKCFSRGMQPKTCTCYDDMLATYVTDYCKKPNANGKDWIIKFNTDTLAVLKKCREEEKTCNNFISKAFMLATTCCLPKSTSSGTTGKSKKRRIIFENRLQNKLFMN